MGGGAQYRDLPAESCPDLGVVFRADGDDLTHSKALSKCSNVNQATLLSWRGPAGTITV